MTIMQSRFIAKCWIAYCKKYKFSRYNQPRYIGETADYIRKNKTLFVNDLRNNIAMLLEFDRRRKTGFRPGAWGPLWPRY